MKPKQSSKQAHGKIAAYDACMTPPYAAEAVTPFLRRTDVVWEPAAGEGWLASGLTPHRIIATDLSDGVDFFTTSPPSGATCIITNPPYSIKYPWLSRCYDLGLPFALLLPVETAGAASAQRLFARHGVEITFVSPRVNFKMAGRTWSESSAQFPVAWFSWRFTGQSLRFHTYTNPSPPRDDTLAPRSYTMQMPEQQPSMFSEVQL